MCLAFLQCVWFPTHGTDYQCLTPESFEFSWAEVEPQGRGWQGCGEVDGFPRPDPEHSHPGPVLLKGCRLGEGWAWGRGRAGGIQLRQRLGNQSGHVTGGPALLTHSSVSETLGVSQVSSSCVLAYVCVCVCICVHVHVHDMAQM